MFLLSIAACFICMSESFAQKTQIVYTQLSPQLTYSVTMLKKAFIEKGIPLGKSAFGMTVDLSIDTVRLEKEGFSVQNDGRTIKVSGGDGRGLIYAALYVIEEVKNGVALSKIASIKEKPHVPFRGIKYDLPWDTYRRSTALDLHKETCRDLKYWEAFLDMMVANRLNALTLWNLHPYSFMIRPKNFPEACPFDDKELKEWQQLFHGLFKMAKERGIDTYIFPFNIFVSPSFAKAHNVALENLEHDFYSGKGDTSELVRRYTRESVAQMLQEYPDITGMGLTHGEYMVGMTQPERDRWMNETIIEGMRLSGRKLKLIHRTPLSSGKAHGGSTSLETELETRKLLEKEAGYDFLEAPIWSEMKFNWSHAHSSPKLVKVHGGKAHGALFDPVTDKFKVIWTARNEDFFCLRWGVPDFVREHVKTNTAPYVGGYLVGSETYIPAKDYFTNPAISVNWKYAFERQWLFYKLWGRLLYNPATPDKVFQDEFVRRYGKQGVNLLTASALAGKTPLRLASAFDFSYDLSLYSEGFMALSGKGVAYISIDQLIMQNTADPSYMPVYKFVKATIDGESISGGKITPLMSATMLEQDCKEALSLVKNINTSNHTALMYEVSDIEAWANIGLHYAEKLRAAVALQTYRTKGGEQNKQLAIAHLQNALKYWDTLIAVTRPIYVDFPAVHLSQQGRRPWRENDHLRFHWEKLRSDVLKDADIAKSSVVISKK